MARILYGVMGDSFGHVSRSLAITQQLAHHEVLFVGGGRVMDLISLGYQVEEVPVLGTYYSNNRVAVTATSLNGMKLLSIKNHIVDRVVQIIKDFNPDLILTDYEYFVPLAARRLGISCTSLDHQHFLTKCATATPPGQTMSRSMLLTALRGFFSNADRYLISSFFALPPLDPGETEVFPPVYRRGVKNFKATEGDHVLVYQTSPTFGRLFSALERMPHRYIIYGFGERHPTRNLLYRKSSRESFLEDLAGSHYIITNGGHNVIAEALYFGKPVLSFPISLAYEQFFNGYMLRELGYGDYSLDQRPNSTLFQRFEEKLDQYRRRIEQGDFYGNHKLAERLEQLISVGWS
jgi:uncharacterized protein (TIGR00661 family)